MLPPRHAAVVLNRCYTGNDIQHYHSTVFDVSTDGWEDAKRISLREADCYSIIYKHSFSILMATVVEPRSVVLAEKEVHVVTQNA